MNQPETSPTPHTVPAIHISSDAQHPAFEVVDAIDDLHGQLGAFRAVAQLAESDRNGQEGLPQLRRADLARLIATLNADLEIQVDKARDAALSMVSDSPQRSKPV